MSTSYKKNKLKTVIPAYNYFRAVIINEAAMRAYAKNSLIC